LLVFDPHTLLLAHCDQPHTSLVNLAEICPLLNSFQHGLNRRHN
jgi:hypothetical protein